MQVQKGTNAYVGNSLRGTDLGVSVSLSEISGMITNESFTANEGECGRINGSACETVLAPIQI